MRRYALSAIAALMVLAAGLALGPDSARAEPQCTFQPSYFWLCANNVIHVNASTWGGTAETYTEDASGAGVIIDYVFARTRGVLVCNEDVFLHWNNSNYDYDTWYTGITGSHSYSSAGCNALDDGLYHWTNHTWRDDPEGINESKELFDAYYFPQEM